MGIGTPPPPDDRDDFTLDDDDEDSAEAWDANDPRRQRDQMAPPREACECSCLHCGRTFMSDQIWFQRVIGDPHGFEGYWMCPTPNCSGAGFTFDIFPTDPDHPANEGWHSFDDEDDYDEFEDDDATIPENAAAAAPSAEPAKEWDPEEPDYKAMDQAFGDSDDDLDGEEWKHGLEPGQLPDPEWMPDAIRAKEEEEQLYDSPDERPRELYWRAGDEGPPPEEDIPF